MLYVRKNNSKGHGKHSVGDYGREINTWGLNQPPIYCVYNYI